MSDKKNIPSLNPFGLAIVHAESSVREANKSSDTSAIYIAARHKKGCDLHYYASKTLHTRDVAEALGRWMAMDAEVYNLVKEAAKVYLKSAYKKPDSEPCFAMLK